MSEISFEERKLLVISELVVSETKYTSVQETLLYSMKKVHAIVSEHSLRQICWWLETKYSKVHPSQYRTQRVLVTAYHDVIKGFDVPWRDVTSASSY